MNIRRVLMRRELSTRGYSVKLPAESPLGLEFMHRDYFG